jgi:hypothetical protein
VQDKVASQPERRSIECILEDKLLGSRSHLTAAGSPNSRTVQDHEGSTFQCCHIALLLDHCLALRRICRIVITAATLVAIERILTSCQPDDLRVETHLNWPDGPTFCGSIRQQYWLD